MDTEIAKLLNLNSNDSNNLSELVNEFFGESWEDGREGIEHDEAIEHDEEDEELDHAGYSEETIDRVECEKISKYSCDCKYFNDQPCYKRYAPENMMRRRMDMRDLTPRDQMLILLGKISSGINLSELTSCSKRKEQKIRKTSQRTTYWLEGQQICRETFKFVHGIGSQGRLNDLLHHYTEYGISPKEKKSGGRKSNTHAFNFDDTQRVARFLTNYAIEHGFILPGRVPGFTRQDIQLLPSSHTKISVYNCYKKFLERTGYRIVGSSSFFDLWKQLCPFIVVCKHMTDLCWTCQNNNNLIFKSANMNEADKSERIKLQEKHLKIVQCERSLYNYMVHQAKRSCQDNDIKELSSVAPCSRNIKKHYSFDYAQQVHLPSNPLQPGPIYFLVPRKYGLFGVCCEGLPRQVNFVIDEAHLISKGSNAVISFLHYFFRNYGIGETDLDLHCDNCSGQNKNRFVLWYFAWRVAVGLHKSITRNFLIAGHTKFAPDWCFGLLKKSFKRHVVPSQKVLVDVVNGSSSVNSSVVPVSNWQTFFDGACKPVPGIKKYQHFRFDANHPGMVFVKKETDSEELEFPLLFQGMDFPQGQPMVIVPPGLPPQRQQYLFKNVRQFVDDLRSPLSARFHSYIIFSYMIPLLYNYFV